MRPAQKAPAKIRGASCSFSQLLQDDVIGFASTKQRQFIKHNNLACNGNLRAAELMGAGLQGFAAEVGISGKQQDIFAALRINLCAGRMLVLG